jgi:hypothetical protein
MAPTNGSIQISTSCKIFWEVLYTSEGVKRTVATRCRTTTIVSKMKYRATVEFTNAHLPNDDQWILRPGRSAGIDLLPVSTPSCLMSPSALRNYVPKVPKLVLVITGRGSDIHSIVLGNAVGYGEVIEFMIPSVQRIHGMYFDSLDMKPPLIRL